MINFEIELDNNFSLDIQVEGFKPARPAPACSNPDSPLYSDSGDCAEWEEMEIRIKFTTDNNPFKSGTKIFFIDIDEATQEEIFDKYEIEILDMCEDYYV